MSIILLENVTNPDSASILEKTRIDISLSPTDIRLSEQESQIKTNFSVSTSTLYVDAETESETTVYYTPIYTEKLSYNTWLTRINKNFEELD